MGDTQSLDPFHLAISVDDLEAARRFYGDVLECTEGRSSDRWVDFNFFGHQLVCHLGPLSAGISNSVDGENVPVPHFGIAMSMADWYLLRDRLLAVGMEFVLEPQVRFEGEVGEQATMFVRDPAGNHLEFKAMQSPGNLFARDA